MGGARAFRLYRRKGLESPKYAAIIVGGLLVGTQDPGNTGGIYPTLANVKLSVVDQL